MAKKSTASAKKTTAKPATPSPGMPNPSRVFKGGMPTTLGMKLVSVTKKKVVAEMPVKDQHRNWNGRVNGGAIMSLADATGAAGASTSRFTAASI
mgnify:CR=1 FL=1